MPRISAIHAHKVLNSRGNWTINTEVELEDGAKGHGEIPEGASKGSHEAVSVPADLAVKIINEKLAPNFCGLEATNQQEIDKKLIEIDGTENKSKLGENTLLSVSIAAAKAVGHSRKIPLYKYLLEVFGRKETDFGIPTPIFNVINGGKHAQNNLSFQEFMAIPDRSLPYDKALEAGVKVYHRLKELLTERALDTQVGDEGGFAPDGLTAPLAFDLISQAIEMSDLKLKQDMFLGMDAASNSFFSGGSYVIPEEKLNLSPRGLMDYYAALLKEYPLIYLEDSFMEQDLMSWKEFTSLYKDKLLITGDDLTVTDANRLEGVGTVGACTAVIVKPNQIGTLTETYAFIKKARDFGMKIVISHRSGEAVIDSFIADLAVATNAEYLKAGAPAHERVAKYNKLLDIYGEVNEIEGFCKV